MTVYEQIIALLDSRNLSYQALEHVPTRTCEESAQVRNTSPDQGAKALVCLADKQPIMIVLPCSRKLDTKLFKSLFNFNDLRFATPDEVKTLTTLEIGSIPPLGQLFNLPTFVDNSLGANEQIAFNAGDHSRSIIIAFAQYNNLVYGQTGNFSYPPQALPSLN